jgi:hypothetical protein
MSDAPEELPNPNPEGQEAQPGDSTAVDAGSLARHYEQDDVDVRGIVRFGIGVGVAIVVATTILAIVLRVWMRQPLPLDIQVSPARVTPAAVPGPGLDAVPETNLQSMLQQENERLFTYGWINRDTGRARIPIDEAMRLLSERGLPAREGEAPTFHLDPSFSLDASGGLEPAGGDADREGGSGEDAGSGEEGVDASSEEQPPDDEDGDTQEGVGDGDEEAGSEEPGDSEAGDSDTGDPEGGDAEAGDDGTAGEDDGGATPGSIEPGDEDAGDEEPGGSQSGS